MSKLIKLKLSSICNFANTLYIIYLNIHSVHCATAVGHSK
ncbi:hypothetical protein PT7_2803 [Pusillimonas sp. T7-7]|nr:hypothetical protein PT7_2803 [Pusillimonas sp. T7-7]